MIAALGSMKSGYPTLLALATFLHILPAQEPAYREEIITPHWVKPIPHSGGTIDALFLVNDLARREPDELGQRFDISVRKVRTLRGSNAYKNVFDIDAFAKQLDTQPDVLVLSAAKPWKDLGPKGLELTKDWVKKGGRLVVFTRSSPERELAEMSVTPGKIESLTEMVSQDIDLEPIFPGKFRDSFEVAQTSHGKGTITLTRPFDRAYVRFNAFFPKLGSWDEPEAARETAYLLANRILRIASGKTGDEEPVEYQVQFRSASGQLLLEAKAKEPGIEIPIPTNGILTKIWEGLDENGKRLRMGSATIAHGVPEPFNIDGFQAPYPRDKPVTVMWTPINGKPSWHVEIGIYDADRNRIRFATAPASAGKLSLPPWQTKQTTHEVRALLIAPQKETSLHKSYIRPGYQILGEHTQWLHLDADPDADQREWTNLAWADERGNLADRWRHHRMRELGLNSIATIGRNVEANQHAAASGLRLVPTNVFVPENRYNKGRFKEEQSKDWLTEFAAGIRPLSPLGYSFADEPPANVILPWLDKGAEVLATADPGARFGYCGVWPGEYTPELMGKSGYLGLYSPGHLYNLNIWLGIERDIYRSFRTPDGIVTIWTHYAPWADHEPYSRTVPWQWLFDGMDGVGYFKSAGMMFGILDGDMRSTHETRWWSEETKELNAGIAEQVKRMERDVGSVRILFGGNLKAVDPWARALNELSIPYKFLDAHKLEAKDLNGVQLLLAVDVGDIGKVVADYVKAGGMLVGGGGLATAQEAPDGYFQKTFGFTPNEMAADSTSDYAGIRATTLMGRIHLEGLTTGECIPASVGGLKWESIGGGSNIPEQLQNLAGSNAVSVGSKGKAIYFAFKPDTDSVKRWLPNLMAQSGVPEPDIRLESEDRVYVARFTDGLVEMIGLVPDYIRIKPSKEIGEIEPNPRDSEDSRQKQQQGYFRHGSQRWDPFGAKLIVGQGKHVYDVRKGKHLGKLQEVNMMIQTGHPELLALLPYPPQRLLLEAPAEVAAGRDLEFRVSVAGESRKHASHVYRAEVTGIPNATANLHAEQGSADGKFSIPHSANPGSYKLSVRDILTGIRVETSLTVSPPKTRATAPLPTWDFRVERHPVDRPEGQWEPIEEEVSDAQTQPATAKVKSMQRKVIHFGQFNGNQHLMTGFTIGNGLRTYEMKYLVCNDPKLFDRGPPQRVKALNSSGLGMNKPRGHLWYYNGYIKIYLGDRDAEMILDYELASIEDLGDDTHARVRLTWEAPSATANLEYVMVPGHEGLFTELTLQPREGKPLLKTTVNFISYPAGFGKGTKPFYEVAQEHQEWLLMGDAIKDRDFYESGKGSAGLLVRPGEWSEMKYNARPLLTAERKEEDAGMVWRLHWVTWMFPERGNAAAKEYMRTNSESTGRRLLKVFAK